MTTLLVSSELDEGASEHPTTCTSTIIVEKELQRLGDPSGKQDAQYWDEWFRIVCGGNNTSGTSSSSSSSSSMSNQHQQHKAFEWYCSSDEAIRVIQYHLHYQMEGFPAAVTSSGDAGDVNDNSNEQPTSNTIINSDNNETDSNYYSMIHPGSGTSLLPIQLRDIYPTSRQVVVDISSIAIQEMKQFHDTTISSTTSAGGTTNGSIDPTTNVAHERSETDNEQQQQTQPINRRPIEYAVCDLLQKESIDSNNIGNHHSFDCWIDKGFIDAIFCKQQQGTEKHQQQKQQSQQLFALAHRTVKLIGRGFVLIITLGEDHSVQMIINNWIRMLNNDMWEPILHIWELQPSSGNLPPIAFVFYTNRSNTNSSAMIESGDAGADSDSEVVVDERFHIQILFHHKDNIDTTIEHFTTYGRILDRINELIHKSRERFMEKKMIDHENDNAHRKQLSSLSKVLAIIEIKTYDNETNLIELGNRIRTTPKWCTSSSSAKNQDISMQWKPFNKTVGIIDDYCHIVPIGYGISKLQLQCIIDREMIDEFVELLEEFDTDIIQSVDVDWSNTIPVREVDQLLHRYLSK